MVVKNIKEEDFEDAVGQDNIARFDHQKNKKKTRKNKKSPGRRGPTCRFAQIERETHIPEL